MSSAESHTDRTHRHLRTWRILAPLSLATIGLGSSLLGYAIELRTTDAGFWTWFVWGTLSLVVLNSGIALFGESVKHRVLYEINTDSETSS
ncbi:MAG: hypothetical protein U5L04_09205 [Trueperaceae bacterium]|nr:hypothetical protein [Trueperaceae bacterium]